MNTDQLPCNFNLLLVYVVGTRDFPPPRNSSEDIELLRVANQALIRKRSGANDALLFIFPSFFSSVRIQMNVALYGFSNVTFIEIPCDVSRFERIENTTDNGQLAIEDEAYLPTVGEDSWLAENEDEIGKSIHQWIQQQHPSAITYIQGLPVNTGFWWAGVEFGGDFLWPASMLEKFASELPQSHRKKTVTWLEAMNSGGSIEEELAECIDDLREAKKDVYAAALCEWLNGFEEACGNGFNDFDAASVCSSLQISDFYLGFEFARMSEDDLTELSDNYDEDITSLNAVCLSILVSGLRGFVCDSLTSFFGGKAELFYALYSTVWPRFEQKGHESLDSLVNSFDHDVLAELDAPWRFVSDGWCDEGDN